MPKNSRPANARITCVIGAATLIDGRRVINCWETWMGGFEIVARYEIADPAQVGAAAEWAQANGAFWEDWRQPATADRPVRGAFEVIDRFVR